MKREGRSGEDAALGKAPIGVPSARGRSCRFNQPAQSLAQPVPADRHPSSREFLMELRGYWQRAESFVPDSA